MNYDLLPPPHLYRYVIRSASFFTLIEIEASWLSDAGDSLQMQLRNTVLDSDPQKLSLHLERMQNPSTAHRVFIWAGHRGSLAVIVMWKEFLEDKKLDKTHL